MQTGTYTFTLQVTDSASPTPAMLAKSFTWTVQPISMNITNFPVTGNSLTYNIGYSQQLLVLGGTGNYNSWQVVSGTLPPGLSLNATTGLVSGAPANTGSFTAGIQVKDTAGATTTQNVTFTVAGPSGVVMNAGNSDSSTIQLGVTTVLAWNPSGGTGPYTYAALTALPPGCVFEFGSTVLGNNGSTYALACTPLATGDYTFTFQITDSVGNIGVRTMVLHVVQFTLFSSTALPNGSVGVPYSESLVIWNAAGVSWSIAAGNALPAGLSISDNSLTGSPAVPGNFSFTLTATDASNHAISYTFSLFVSTIHITTPEIIPQSVITNVPYSYTMTAAGGGATKTWTATGLPAGITMSSTGMLSGTTTSTGTFRIMVMVTDGASTYTHSFTLFARYNDPPVPSLSVLTTELADTRVGASVSFTLSPSGGTPPFTWTVAPGSSLPPGLTLISGNSLSSYSSDETAGLTYLAGSPSIAASYSFDLIATDSTGTQMRRTFTLNVTPMAILAGALRTPTTGVPYSEQLQGLGGTPPYTFTYSKSGLRTDMFPPGITATASGLISGTTMSTGSFGLMATAHDSAGHMFTTTYSYTAVNAFGVAVTTAPPLTWRWGVGTTTTLATNGASTYTWSVSAGSLPAGLALVPSGSSTLLAGAPQVYGTFSYTLRATDNGNPSNYADRAYTVLIGTPSPDSRRIYVSMPPARTGTPYSFNWQAYIYGGTPPYTFSTSPLSPLPPGLTLSPAGVLSGTPTAVGSYSFTFLVTDASGSSVYTTPRALNVLGPGMLNPLQGTNTTLDQASVSAPYPGQLDGAASGGVPPYVWTLAPGSRLPPGISILPGSNGVSSYLGGIPTTAGTYNFALNVTDSAGQMGTSQFTLVVSPLAASPAMIPNGTVGTAYSVQYIPSGGTPPYRFAIATGSGVPPGLSLSTTGTLSGMPTDTGYFSFIVTITDAAGNTLTATRIIDIDDAHGTARGIGMSDTIQMNYTLTAPTPAPVPINVAATSGPLPFTAAVEGIPGATLSATSGTAPTTLNLTLNTGSLTAGTYAGVVAVNSTQAANVYTQTPVILTVTNAPPCTYTLTPPSGSIPSTGGVGSFGVATGPLCQWFAVPSAPSWVSIVSGGGVGPGTVVFFAPPNTGSFARDSNITVAGQTYTVTQFPVGSACSFTISPSGVDASASGGYSPVTVIPSNPYCAWSASGLGAYPSGGVGFGGTMLQIPPNPTAYSRTLNATIAGQVFTVAQAGVNCTVSVSPPSILGFPSSGGSMAVSVSAPIGCIYGATNVPSWIQIFYGQTGSGPGPNTMAFYVLPNSTTTSRSATLSIGGQPFTISQSGIPCSMTVDSSALSSPLPALGGSAAVNVTANGQNCSWTASTLATWATVAPMSGAGSGAVTVTVTSNAASATARSTSLMVAGTSVGVTEAGTACTYSLGSATASVPYGGGSGSVTVTAPGVCAWGASTDPNASWLTIASTGSGGTSEVTFVAAPNPTSSPRSGALTIAGQSYTVTEGAAPCKYVLSGSSTTVAAAGASSSFTFSTGASGCSATAVSYAGWLTVSTSSSPDGTSGTVSYTAAANPAGATRSGTIQFGGQMFTVNQTGAACAYSLNAYGALLPQSGGSGTVLASQSAVGCAPTVGTDQPTIVTLGALSGPTLNIYALPYSVAPFSSVVTATRLSHITFGGQIFAIKQTSW